MIVGPADLSRTIYSDVSVYYLFPELVPATCYIEMDPGLADREGSGLADDIATADCLLLTNFWTGWNEPNASDEYLSDEHNQAVADNFCLVGQYEDNLVLLFERCEGGGGISPADITGRYPIPPDDGAERSRAIGPGSLAPSDARSPSRAAGGGRSRCGVWRRAMKT